MHPVDGGTSLSAFGLLVAALLLSIERICYAWAWHHPQSFQRFCARSLAAPQEEAPEVLERLFYGFKVLQLSVFLHWCLVYGDGVLWPSPAPAGVVAMGIAAIVLGQVLNASVFHRLGRTGVFYGDRMGHDVPWVEGFPFSLLKHPQYVGAVLSIWGLFLVLRFPHDDWIVLPLIETLYYLAGAWCES